MECQEYLSTIICQVETLPPPHSPSILDYASAIVPILMAIVAFYALYQGSRRLAILERSQQTLEQANLRDAESKKSDAFIQNVGKASELLASNDMHQRVMGVSLLGNIARYQEEFVSTIVGQLVTFLKIKSKDSKIPQIQSTPEDIRETFKDREEDIQVSIDLLGEIWRPSHEDTHLDLRYMRLHNIAIARKIKKWIGIDLDDSSLYASSFTRGAFEKIQLRRAHLLGSTCRDASFTEVDFLNGQLGDCLFIRCKFYNCRLENVSTHKTLSFKDCIFSECRFLGFENNNVEVDRTKFLLCKMDQLSFNKFSGEEIGDENCIEDATIV